MKTILLADGIEEVSKHIISSIKAQGHYKNSTILSAASQLNK